MRRTPGVIAVAVLVAALCSRATQAAGVPSLAYSSDLGAGLLQRVFGESADARFALEARYGDPNGESLLRSYAFHVSLVPHPALAAALPSDLLSDAAELAARYGRQISQSFSTGVSPAYEPIALGAEQRFGISLETPAPLVAAYQPVAPPPAASAGPGTFDLSFGSRDAQTVSPIVSFTPIFSPIHGFDAGFSGTPKALEYGSAQSDAVSVPVPVRLGNLHVQTRFEGAQVQSPQLSLDERASGIGANFDVRAGNRNVNVDLSSRFEHMTRNADATFASSNFDGTSTLQLPADRPPVLIPAYADVSKRTLSTGIAVPVTRSLTLGMQYDTEHLQGGYGVPGLSNLDANNNTYGAKLTFALPHSASAISLSAKQYRYQDNLIPTNAFTQTRADLNFTVKF
ncbi:MAG TPA: hypothetical protein VMW12_12075 [Candidatus Dormibacteraeota bacterium]|nr:hypothetical protein [Candidatus Dormibacteraeota bacterium]